MFVKSLFKLKCTTFSIPFHCIGLSNMKHAFTQIIPDFSKSGWDWQGHHYCPRSQRKKQGLELSSFMMPVQASACADFWPALWSSALPHPQQEPTALWRGGPPTTGDTLSPLPNRKHFIKCGLEWQPASTGPQTFIYLTPHSHDLYGKKGNCQNSKTFSNCIASLKFC